MQNLSHYDNESAKLIGQQVAILKRNGATQEAIDRYIVNTDKFITCKAVLTAARVEYKKALADLNGYPSSFVGMDAGGFYGTEDITKNVAMNWAQQYLF